MKFKFEWTDGRVPKEVTFPDGHVETTGYMRDGLCLFKSGHSTTYERISDHSAEFTVIESFEEARLAAGSYLAKQEVWKNQ